VTETHYLIRSGYVVTGADDGALRVARGGVDATLELDAGTYYLRGDGASDDLATAIVDKYVAAYPAASGSVSASVTHDFRRGSTPATSLALTDSSSTWAPDHAHGDTTIPARVTGWPATAPTAAATITAALSSDVCYVPAPSPGTWTPDYPALGAVTRMVDGSVQSVERSETHAIARLMWDLLAAARVTELEGSADPAATLEAWLARSRWTPLEVWRVEVDSSLQHDSASDAATLVGTYHLDESTATGGVGLARTGSRVPYYTASLGLLEVP